MLPYEEVETLVSPDIGLALDKIHLRDRILL